VMTKTESVIGINLPKNKKKVWYNVWGILCSAFLIFTLLLHLSASWYIRHYGETGFDSVIFTLLSNIKGTSNELLISFCLESALPMVLCGGALIYVLFIRKFKKTWYSKIRFWHKAAISLFFSMLLLLHAGTKVDIFGYIQKMMIQTTIYEEHFIEPCNDNISFPDDKRNLIYIFLESMETSYMSETEGGALPENVMPELTRLAKENINFSQNDGIGGFLTPSGTGWTVAGMVSQTSGVPLKGSVGALGNNEYGTEEFMPGVVSLSDILSQNGYKQALMVGSDASYANRRVYFAQHNTDYIYDYITAKEDSIIDDDYYVWWGMEDELLFEYAKDKIRQMAKEPEPFSFTLLTVDTHFPDGYVCDLCKNRFNEQYNNVISCASHQVEKFVNWIKRQDFFENTTIVICGDHLSMDNQYITRNVPDNYERRVYNCFINSAVTGENYKNRIFTSLDIFPTTLAAMGCDIKGDRLGLGTNLFSQEQTLAEKMGYEEFDRALLYSSNYYIKKFLINQE